MLVDRIEESKLTPDQRAELPGLYHPKMPGSPPWLEIAIKTLRSEESWYKRWGRLLAFKANVTATLLSLIAQHYYLTLSHGVKRTQVEPAVRAYVEKQMTVYSESRKGIRATIFKPFRPFLEKLAKWLRKRYEAEQRKQSGASRARKGSKR